jgi:TPP-dependent pyruvate/acetoin dehydrogenase alpha subunit
VFALSLTRCFLAVAPRPQLTKDEGMTLYEDMYMGRAFEDMCAQARGAPCVGRPQP